jgi:hypothetical protein
MCLLLKCALPFAICLALGSPALGNIEHFTADGGGYCYFTFYGSTTVPASYYSFRRDSGVLTIKRSGQWYVRYQDASGEPIAVRGIETQWDTTSGHI